MISDQLANTFYQAIGIEVCLRSKEIVGLLCPWQNGEVLFLAEIIQLKARVGGVGMTC